MWGSLVNFCEVLCYQPLHCFFLLMYFHLAYFILPHYFRDHWMRSSNFEEFIRLLVKLLHLPTPHQSCEIFRSLETVHLLCYRHLLPFFFELRSCSIANGLPSSLLLLFQLFNPCLYLFLHFFYSKILMSGSADSAFSLNHLCCRLLVVGQLAECHLWKMEVMVSRVVDIKIGE